MMCLKGEKDETLPGPYQMKAFQEPGQILRWGEPFSLVDHDDRIPLPAWVRTDQDFLELIMWFASICGLAVEPLKGYPAGPTYRLFKRKRP
ncbi:MAG: hypothetical protein ACRCZE_01020 [Candidatus Altimarinota bacterium]